MGFSVSSELIRGMALAAFFLVQIIAGAMVAVARYHFKNFALPDDRRAKSILNIMGVGAVAAFIAAALALSEALNQNLNL